MVTLRTESHLPQYWWGDTTNYSYVDIHRQYSVKDVEQDYSSQSSSDSQHETITVSYLPDSWSGPVESTQRQRDEIREKLLKAGFLITDIETPYMVSDYLDEELPLIILPPNSPSVAQLVDEDRGEY